MVHGEVVVSPEYQVRRPAEDGVHWRHLPRRHFILPGIFRSLPLEQLSQPCRGSSALPLSTALVLVFIRAKLLQLLSRYLVVTSCAYV